MSNKNPTMKNASKNLSKILNPKPTKKTGYWAKQEEIKNFLAELK
jgi:hypothetical protein